MGRSGRRSSLRRCECGVAPACVRRARVPGRCKSPAPPNRGRKRACVSSRLDASFGSNRSLAPGRGWGEDSRLYQPKENVMSELDSLKQYTTVVADTGDIGSMAQYKP